MATNLSSATLQKSIQLDFSYSLENLQLSFHTCKIEIVVSFCLNGRTLDIFMIHNAVVRQLKNQ